MSLIKLVGLEKTYQQGKIAVPALRGVDLEIESGEFTTIFGPSGSGKTTLLNMIGCLDKSTAGDIIFDDHSINDLDNKELAEVRRYNLGFVFQSYNLIPVLTAFENVEFAIRLIDKYSKKERRDKVMSLLEEVGLGDMAGRRPNELSGGQKQR
ncbi:MAG: ABC transporter ATP-binding protein, partial [Halanaerobium sp.]